MGGVLVQVQAGVPLTIIGLAASCFDLLHAGHIHYLTEARKQCDYLKVALQTNPQLDRMHKNAPVQTMYERWIQLRALACVDEIIPYDTEADLENLLVTQKHHLRFVGSDYEDQVTAMTGWRLYKWDDNPFNYPRVMFIHRLHTFSSTDLRKRLTSCETKS